MMPALEHPLQSQRVILDLCGGSGAWSAPYAKAGYRRIIVDPTQILRSDVRLYPSLTSTTPRFPSEYIDIREQVGSIHGILAAPVCTVFAGSGARWKRSDKDMTEALALVDACIRLAYALKPVWWAMENPVGKLVKWIGDPVMSFNPSDYGDTYTKRTLLWGDFNVVGLEAAKNPVIATEGSKILKWGGKSERTKSARSITPAGFAQAFFEANP